MARLKGKVLTILCDGALLGASLALFILFAIGTLKEPLVLIRSTEMTLFGFVLPTLAIMHALVEFHRDQS